jgi:outer membrane lipoprotein carrier protein
MGHEWDRFNIVKRRVIMRKVSFWVCLGSALLFCTALPGLAKMTGQTLLTEIQGRYEKTDDLEANFVQEYIGKVMKTPQKGEGKVYLKKKGMMRWDYRVPNQKLISNGSTLWFYQPDEKQVFVSDVQKVLKEKTPLAFLAGEGDLSRDFKLLNFNESISQKEENYIVELAPKEQNPVLAKLVLTVDKNTYYVVQADVIDGLGNVTRSRFVDIKTNLGLSNALFNFTVPPGTEVLKMPEPAGASPGGKGTGTK